MHIKTLIILIGWMYVCFACQNPSQTHTHNHAKHQGKTDNKTVAEATDFDCKNCGMPSKDYPKWNVKAKSNEKEIWFCSPKCMFVATLNESSPLKIDQAKVSDYYELKRMDAKNAFYVIGSDVQGPMGHDFVPLKDAKAAEDFKKEHQGSKILRFAEINQTVLKEVVAK